jgi:restriction endonuclease S subunit
MIIYLLEKQCSLMSKKYLIYGNIFIDILYYLCYILIMAILCLKDVSDTQIGLILKRKKAEGASPYVYRQLTLRSLETDRINYDALSLFYSKEPLQNEFLTKAGTIVMKLFAPFNPAVITKETEGYLIPSQMVVIKPDKRILPEYLRFYLAQDFVSEHLLAKYFWIAQKAITVEALSNLEVRIPSLKNQQLICDYYQNYRHLCRLRVELEKEEKSMMKYIFSVLSNEKEYDNDNQKRH